MVSSVDRLSGKAYTAPYGEERMTTHRTASAARAGLSRGACWIWKKDRQTAVDCHLLFRREFVLPSPPETAVLRIASHDQYRLFVNGRIVGDGPCRSEIPVAYVDEYDCRRFLRVGKNAIGILCHSTGLPQHGRNLSDGCVTLSLECRLRSGTRILIVTNTDWRVCEAPHYAKPAPRRFFAVGFNEKYVPGREPSGWTEAGFDDSAWEQAQVVSSQFSRLLSRPIPMLKFSFAKPVAIRQSGVIGKQDGVWGLAFDRCANRFPDEAAVFGTYLYAARRQDACLHFGCDNSSRVRLNGTLIWEQEPPGSRFAFHLGIPPAERKGMVRGNGHRYEPGSTRLSSGASAGTVRLRKGWNRLTVWIWRPQETYGFEGAFVSPSAGVPPPTVCSATRNKNSPHTWMVMRSESGIVGKTDVVRTVSSDMRPHLEPSHLWDWDGWRPAPVRSSSSLLAGQGGANPFVIQPGRFVEYRLPCDCAGFLEVEAQGPSGAYLDVTISEAQTRLEGGRVRSLYNGLWQTDRIVLSGRRDRWRSLDRRAGRYLGIVVRNSRSPVVVYRLGIHNQRYPAPHQGTFACSDGILTRMWEVGAATVNAATFDVMEDCPTREAAQWTGDAYLRTHQIAYLWGDMRLSAKAVREIAADQLPDRWSRQMVPGGYQDRIAEYALLLPVWVIDHYRYTADLFVVRDAFDGIRNLLFYASSLADERGFARKGNDPMDCHYIDYTMSPVIRRCGEPLLAMQALYVMALEQGAEAAFLLGEKSLAGRWKAMAEGVRQKAREMFWSEKEGLFSDGLNEAGCGDTFTAVSNYWALLARIPSPAQEGRVLRRLYLSPDRENMELWRPGESGYTKFFSSEALLSRGLWRETLASWRGFYGTMLRHPEAQCAFEWWDRSIPLNAPVPRNSLVHPFSIGPMRHLASHICGIKSVRAGFRALLWEPMPADLLWIRAEFPLPSGAGRASVRMERRRSGGRHLVLVVPEKTAVRVSRRYLNEEDTVELRKK